VRAFFLSILGSFLSPFGIVLMGILDASMVFFLPLGIDFVVIVMSARTPDLFWLYALLATLGSVIGAGGTFWIGKKAGEKGLTRFVRPRRLERVKARVGRGTFVLAAGAFGMSAWTFLTALAGVRVFRFAVEAALASYYGSQILRWMKTPMFTAVVGVFIALALVGTVASAIALVRGSRRQGRESRRAVQTR